MAGNVDFGRHLAAARQHQGRLCSADSDADVLQSNAVAVGERVRATRKTKAPALATGAFFCPKAFQRLGLPPISSHARRRLLVTPPIKPPSVGLAASALPRAGAVLVQNWYFSGAAPILERRQARLRFLPPHQIDQHSLPAFHRRKLQWPDRLRPLVGRWDKRIVIRTKIEQNASC